MTAERAGDTPEATAERLLVAINRALDQAEKEGPRRFQSNEFRAFMAGIHHGTDAWRNLTDAENEE